MFTSPPLNKIQFKSVQLLKDDMDCVSEISDMQRSGLLMKELQQSFGFDYDHGNYNESTSLFTQFINGDKEKDNSSDNNVNKKESDIASIYSISDEFNTQPKKEEVIAPSTPEQSLMTTTEDFFPPVRRHETCPNIADLFINDPEESCFKTPILQKRKYTKRDKTQVKPASQLSSSKKKRDMKEMVKVHQ